MLKAASKRQHSLEVAFYYVALSVLRSFRYAFKFLKPRVSCNSLYVI